MNEKEEMEKSIKAIAEYVKSQLSELRRDFATRDDVETLKEKITAGKGSEDLINRLQDLEDELRDLKRKDSSRDISEIKKELQRDVSDLKFEYDEKLLKQETELEKLSLARGNDYGEKLRTLEDELRALKVRPALPEAKELERRIEHLEMKKPEQDKGYEELEKELKEIKKLGSSKPVILANFKHEMEREIIRLRQELETKIRDHAPVKEIDDKHLEQELEELRKKVQNLQSDDGIEKQLRELRIKVRSLEQMPHPAAGGDMGHALEEEQAERMALEKHVQDLRKEMEDIKATPAPNVNTLKLRQEIDALKKTVTDMRLSVGKKGGGEDVIDDVNELKHTLDEEIANRMSLEKHLQDMQQQLRERKTTEAKIDYNLIVKNLQEDKTFKDEIDKKSNMDTMRLITKQLEEYAHTLDKRLPNVATREDLTKLEKKLEQRLRLPIRMEEESIGHRMDDLEMSMNNLITVLRTLQGSSKNPFVIE